MSYCSLVPVRCPMLMLPCQAVGCDCICIRVGVGGRHPSQFWHGNCSTTHSSRSWPILLVIRLLLCCSLAVHHEQSNQSTRTVLAGFFLPLLQLYSFCASLSSHSRFACFYLDSTSPAIRHLTPSHPPTHTHRHTYASLSSPSLC